MADKTDAEAKAAEKLAAEQAAAPVVGFVRVSKHDETLMIHPSTLAAHKAAGWKT